MTSTPPQPSAGRRAVAVLVVLGWFLLALPFLLLAPESARLGIVLAFVVVSGLTSLLIRPWVTGRSSRRRR